MSESKPPTPGTIGWFDLTVPDAPAIRDFYGAVTGWRAEGVDMGEYEDFAMTAADGTAVAGVCHARGKNDGLPPQWLAYVVVEDVERSAAVAAERGGTVLRDPTDMGSHGRYCVVRDPAGAVLALFQPAGG